MPDLTEVGEQLEEIDRLLRTVSGIVRRRGRDILVNFDITPPQFNALQILIHHEDEHNEHLTIGDLGEDLYLACSTATDLIDRMERNGLVERERDTSDRRIIRVRVLEKGRQVITEVLAARHRYLEQALHDLTSDELTHMIGYLRKLEERMVEPMTAQGKSAAK